LATLDRPVPVVLVRKTSGSVRRLVLGVGRD
jgi:hypothetical protein